MYPNACFLATFLLSCTAQLLRCCQLLATTAYPGLAINKYFYVFTKLSWLQIPLRSALGLKNWGHDRSVRRLVKLFNIDEHQVQEDLDELQRKIDMLTRRPDNIDDIALDVDSGTSDDDGQDDDRSGGQVPGITPGLGDAAGSASNDATTNDLGLQESGDEDEAMHEMGFLCIFIMYV